MRSEHAGKNRDPLISIYGEHKVLHIELYVTAIIVGKSLTKHVL